MKMILILAFALLSGCGESTTKEAGLTYQYLDHELVIEASEAGIDLSSLQITSHTQKVIAFRLFTPGDDRFLNGANELQVDVRECPSYRLPPIFLFISICGTGDNFMISGSEF